MHGEPDQPAEDPTLRILMAEYQAGSAEAFNRLHDALAPDLRAYLAMLSRDTSRADDLLQETFLQIHRSRAVHTPGEPVRPWVFAIAKRVFLMYRRSASRRARHEVVPGAPADAVAVNPIGAEHLHAQREVELALQHAPAERAPRLCPSSPLRMVVQGCGGKTRRHTRHRKNAIQQGRGVHARLSAGPPR